MSISFSLTEEQELTRRTIRDLLAREAPRERVRAWDEEGVFPAELFDKVGKLGLFGLPFPEEYGGAGADAVSYAIAIEEFAKVDFDLAGGYVSTTFNGLTLLEHGNKEQREYYIPRICRGDTRLSVSMTEADAGSDVASLKTSARLDGNSWLINGSKMFCTAARQPKNTIIVCARTDPDLPKHRGLTLFLVDVPIAGLEMRRLPLLGLRLLGAYALYLDDVAVLPQHVLGEVNGGWRVMLTGLDIERMVIGAECTGSAQTVVDDAIRYAREREQFGQPIGKFQVIAHMLADMQTDVDAARLLTYRTAALVSEGKPAGVESSMAKLFGSEMFARVANKGMQIMGGFGYTLECDMQRFFRNARITTIVGGTSQIQREIIAKRLIMR